MPYCPECGVELQIGQKYCHKCGFNPYSKDKEGWWEATSEDEPEPKTEPETTQATEAAETTIGYTALTISSGGLIFGLFSPWSWYDSGLQALRYTFSDLSWLLTDGSFFWEFDALGYILWLMDILLPLVFVTTFVATWYKSLRGDEKFGRKARFFYLSFFVVMWIISLWVVGTMWLPSEENYGTWIAAASGIGLHSTGRNSGRTQY